MAFENVFQGRLVLFNNSKKESQNQPDLTGNIEFSQADAMAMAEWITGQPGEENYKGERVIKVNVSAWHKESKKGTGFISGQMSVQKKESNMDEIPF